MRRRYSRRFQFAWRTRARVRRDDPACIVRLYVGSGVPSDAAEGRYAGLPTSFEPEAFWKRLQSIVHTAFENVTFLRARGSWMGGAEDSVVVEIVDTPSPDRGCDGVAGRAHRLARTLAKALRQQAVMVVSTDPRGRSKRAFVTAA